MPIIQSAKKKLRQDKKRTVTNDAYRHLYKDALREVRQKRPQKGTLSADELNHGYSVLDKASKQHIIHPNKAARLKSRMTKLQAPSK